MLTIKGDANGNSEGMAWNPGVKYGRWEARVRAPAADKNYHAVLLLWPDSEKWPNDGEVDFMENSDPTRQRTGFFLHYGNGTSDGAQLTGAVGADATQWHNWAVEWAPDHITAYLDGKQWWTTTKTSTLPPGPMHMTIQLDDFRSGAGLLKPSSMQVDWVLFRCPPLAVPQGGARPSRPGDRRFRDMTAIFGRYVTIPAIMWLSAAIGALLTFVTPERVNSTDEFRTGRWSPLL